MNQKLHPVVMKILKARGINTESEILEFISDRPSITHDPFLMQDLREAAEVLCEKISDGIKICIYGDYDADGVTSVGILWNILSEVIKYYNGENENTRQLIETNLSYYIPSRFAEGYGLNKGALDEISSRGVRLIVTVDCGSSNIEEVRYAQSLGMDVIVTDHHSVGEEFPDCLFLNPNRGDCRYPFKELAGCGVAFKLAQGIQKTLGLEKKVINNLLELVAIGTLADIMPVIDENRTLVKYGLARLAHTPGDALRKLLEKFEISPEEINTDKVTYLLAPMINSAGRLGHADDAVKLLLRTDDTDIDEQIDVVFEMNKNRKQMQEALYMECLAQVDESKSIILLCPKNSHEGIAGVVAGKLKQYFMRPVIIFSETKSGYKGTARSTDSFDIYDFLAAHKEFLVAFGGHRGACGMTVEFDRIGDLIAALEHDMDEYLALHPEVLVEKTDYDALLEIRDINVHLFDSIQILEPFGRKNEKPKFALNDVEVRDVWELGEAGKHIKFRIRNKQNFTNLECLLFNVSKEQRRMLTERARINITGNVGMNEFRGNTTLQFIVDRIF